MITGNKGEWSEIYTLLKILGDKKLNAGDGNLNKLEGLIFPIIKVLRDESNGTFEFSYDNNLVLVKNEQEEFKIPINKFQEQAHFLLTKLQGETKRTFSVSEIEEFLNTFNSQTLKAKSTVKSDIRVVIHDQRTGTEPELGFSIKSQLGGASTLLNAGKTTNFIYEIKNTNFSDGQIQEINQIDSRSKIQKRVEKIRELNGILDFQKLESSVFNNNLLLIDSALPKIMAEIILLFFSSKHTKLSDLVAQIIKQNPLKFDLQDEHPFYTYKIKKLLTDIALGMMPSKVWTGKIDATGGYLVVKEDGEILCYHIYNQNEFQNYLYTNTKLETASSSRHKFGQVYKENENIYFKLNLQIRFL